MTKLCNKFATTPNIFNVTDLMYCYIAAGTRGAEGAMPSRFSLCPSIIPRILNFCDSFVINYTLNQKYRPVVFVLHASQH